MTQTPKTATAELKLVVADLTLDRHILQARELAAVRVRFGYRRLSGLLKREGWRVNAKRIYRLYGDEGLTVRTKPRKRLASRPRCRCQRRRDPTSGGAWTSSARGSSTDAGFAR